MPDVSSPLSPDPQPPPASASAVGKHYRRYLSAQLMGTLAGFISVPIMNRLLTAEQYGVLGYYELFPLVWIACLKLGTQHSIQRFWPAWGEGQDPAKRKQYFASVVAVPALISTSLCLISLVLLTLWHRFSELAEFRYLVLVLVIGQIGVLSSLIDNVMRARELSKLASRIAIFHRYGDLALVLTTVWLTRSVVGFYFAKLASGLALTAYYTWWARRECELNVRHFHAPMFKESFSFGMPLVINEISLVMLAFADRIMMKELLPGDSTQVNAQLGYYTIGYQWAMQIGVFMRGTLTSAYQPVANRLYEHQGAAAVRALKHRLLKTLMYVCCALIAGLLLVGRDVMLILASADKIEATPVFQWVGINYALLPIFNVAAYGLILVKQTRKVSYVVLASTFVNIFLNLWLIPKIGIMGAVYATLVSYAFMGIVQILLCPPDLRSFPGPRELVLPIGLGLLLYFATGTLLAILPLGELPRLVQPLIHLAVAGVCFALLYILPAMTLDRDLREWVKRTFPATRRFLPGA